MKKQEVRVLLTGIYEDDLRGDVDLIVKKLSALSKEKKALGFSRVEIELEEQEWGIDVSIDGIRMETDKEFETRKTHFERRQAEREEKERLTYEELKNKYESTPEIEKPVKRGS